MKKTHSSNNRKKLMMSIDQAKKIGIIFCYSQSNLAIIESFMQLLKQKHIVAKAIAYIDMPRKKGIVEDRDNIKFYYKDEIIFNKTPQCKAAEDFINTEIEVLIDMSDVFFEQNLYIANACIANFKIGRDNTEWGKKVFDFAVSTGEYKDITVEMLIHTILDYSANFDISKQ